MGTTLFLLEKLTIKYNLKRIDFFSKIAYIHNVMSYIQKLILVLLVVPFFFSAQALLPSQLEEFINQMYLQQKSDSQMAEDYSQLVSEFNQEWVQIKESATSEEKAKFLIRLASLEYYMGRVYQSIDSVQTEINKNAALRAGRLKSLIDFHTSRESIVKHHEAALAHIQKIQDLQESEIPNEILAETYALKSEVLNQLCLFKSIDYSIKNFSYVDRYARKALELNPYNIRAFLMVVSAWIYCPPIYGGKPAKALEQMDKFNWPENLRSEDRYNYLLSKAYCYMRLKDETKATDFLTKALSIYPTNAFSNAMKTIMEQGGF